MADATDARPLVPLPPHPRDLAWPTEAWPEGPPPPGVDLTGLLDEVMADDGPLATTLAAVVVHHGRIVGERYRSADGVDADTTLISWSMAKSITHALVGVLVGRGALALDEPAPVREWQSPEDPRRQITLEQLLTMRDGLDFVEDYVDGEVSDTIKMLFGEGQHDVAGYAAARRLRHAPGTVFNYSSGTTNIVARIVRDAAGGTDGGRRLVDDLFATLGMSSASARYDDQGVFIGSSYVHATARDFARFGYLYLRDGCWEGRRVLPEGWVDHGRKVRSQDEDTGNHYGAHWWAANDEAGTFWASGYEGQSILVSPGRDLVVVRLGKTPAERHADLRAWRRRVVEAFA